MTKTVAEIAYELWEQEGCPQGKEWEHWFRAETMLASAAKPAPAKKAAAPKKPAAATKPKVAAAKPATPAKKAAAKKAAPAA